MYSATTSRSEGSHGPNWIVSVSHMGLKALWRSRRRACSSGDLEAVVDMVMFSLVCCVVVWWWCEEVQSKVEGIERKEGRGRGYTL